MTRKEFIKLCGLLGISSPFQSVLTSCNKESIVPNGFSGSVLIIGAGAAGMASAYLLEQKGIDFQLLEASDTFGGRMKRTTSFVDFPIPLGAEWLHVAETELDNIVNNVNTQINLQTIGYQPQEQIGYYENGSLFYSDLAEEFGDDFIDKKFINTSWLDFFEQYVVPSISTKMNFNSHVISIDYQGEKIMVACNNGQTYTADKIIITVPIKILQDRDIAFSPQLPLSHRNAIEEAPIWSGIKVFLEFSQKFYPAYLTFPDSETQSGQRIYYNAAYGQNSTSHVLGLVALGEQAKQYQELTGNAQRDYILNELDNIFDGMASQTYVNHIVQDWSEEPFIRSAYLADIAPSNISTRLSQSIDEKIYFAGEAYTQEDDWGGVHNATQSARDVISAIG